jgi:hypothetical protein
MNVSLMLTLKNVRKEIPKVYTRKPLQEKLRTSQVSQIHMKHLKIQK